MCKSRRRDDEAPDFTLSFSCALPLAHTHRMACISIHRRSRESKSCINGNILSFIKGWLLHQPTVSDGYTASICPGVVSCSKSALILTNSVCIQSCKLRSLLVSVTLLKEFQLTGMYHQDFANHSPSGVACFVPIIIEISADFTVIPFSFTYSTYAVYVCPSTALAGAVPPTIV